MIDRLCLISGRAVIVVGFSRTEGDMILLNIKYGATKGPGSH
jgi:hypothetical protein